VSELALRDVTLEDAALLRAWRNDPSVRASSFNQDVIDEQTHRDWLAKKLASADTRMWILTADGVPAGQVRYDKTDDTAEVSVSLGAAFRGKGYGVAILTMSAQRACTELALKEIRAVVKLTNAASLNAFTRAGFHRGPDAEVHGDPSAIFFWRCSRASV
jgi:RimJ/RimL family protein N-acetyltransferase